jgi:flagellar biosynthesis protein FlhF
VSDGGPSFSEVREVTEVRPSRSDQAGNGISAQLEAAGLDPMLAREVARAHPRDLRRGASPQTLRRTLAEHLAPLSAQDADYAPIEVFVGPPGVGKTTTIAKIATHELALNGRRMGLVAADGFRVGAVEQLRVYADILRSPLTVARTPAELEAALDLGRRPLLVDTAGRSASDHASREILRVLAARVDVRVHLVVAADTPVPTLRRVLERFECARPSRLVLTKMDEAESMGEIVALVREADLPVSYLGTGQNVPGDLQVATPKALAGWVAGDSMMNVPAVARSAKVGGAVA